MSKGFFFFFVQGRDFPCFTHCVYPGRERTGFNEFKHLRRQTNDNAFVKTGLCRGPKREPGTPAGTPSPELPVAPRRFPAWEGAGPPPTGGHRPLSRSSFTSLQSLATAGKSSEASFQLFDYLTQILPLKKRR